MDRCIACASGFCYECFEPVSNSIGWLCCCPTNNGSPVGELVTRQQKDGEDMKDVISTGRKRAAELFPITDGMPCEWQQLKFAGGGVVPIVGCVDGIATDRHHGPDKSTLNNGVGNVHRICAKCHNRWHTRNDPAYGPRPEAGRAFVPIDGASALPHDSETKATTQDLYESEMYWQSNKLTKRVG